MRTFGGLASLWFAAIGAACQFPYPADVPDDDAPGMRALGGGVTGLWTGGAVTLRLTAGDVSEDLAADGTAPFTFANRLLDGTSYLVAVVDDGPDHDCAVTNGSGRVSGADLTDLAVACTNLIPHGLTISTAVPFTFDPRVTRYPLPVSILQQDLTVVVSGATLTSAKVAGQTVTLGQPSALVPLGQGMTTVTVDVTKGALSQRYELVFDRGGTPIVEALYGRASNAGTDDFFGSSVAASGEYAAIGARWEDSSSPAGDNNAISNAGAVYIFRRAGATWIQRQILKGSLVAPNREFGDALAMEDDLLVVGARRDDAGATDAGAVYVFRLNRATDQWTEEQRLMLPSPRLNDWFGSSVAISRGVIAVGCQLCEVSGVRDAGAVHVFERTGGTWVATGMVQASTLTDGGAFGYGISLDQGTLAVLGGARVHVFQRTGGNWNPQSTPPELFGPSDVNVRGDTMAIGEPSNASGTGQPGDTSAPNSGAVIVMTRSGGSWSRSALLKSQIPAVGASLGNAVALGRDVIVASERAGARVQPFLRVGGTWIPQPPTIPSMPDPNGELGMHVAATGEVVIVSQERDNGGGLLLSGAVFFFR